MTLPHVNKMKAGLRSRLRLQGEPGAFRMELQDCRDPDRNTDGACRLLTDFSNTNSYR